ncbi:TonB-dependent receptor [Capnocytophaga sp.]|uniref:TonB-dependent receptor n=1 Tax=Capnocytophaga sp. TaxID=44737 RepID=UPI0026DD80AB|nr:TonB-dependent receptor [Capnocytophaga sp.]MDO5104588.1 TonB-dependent receptor [Capnocytophaga sp.]
MKNIMYLLIFCGVLSYGQESLRLKIEDKSGQPLTGAVIHFLGKHYLSDTNGNVAITNLKAGTYPLRVSYLGYDDAQHQVKVPTSVSPFVVTMHESVNELSEIVVASRKEIAHRNTVVQLVGKEDLQRKSGESLAHVLASLRGVSMLQSGATIAKPIIHGLHSNRILILNNDIRQEGQQWGADHAPEIDPSVANRIAVVKGADAVRYGSDALGGVVLLSPEKLPYGDALHGEVSPSFASNGRKTATSLKLETAVPSLPQWAWRVQASAKRSGDVQTADYHLNNTGQQEQNVSVATGIEKERWNAELFYSRYYNETAVFYGSHIGNLDDLLARFEIGRPLTTYPFSYQINAPKQEVVHHLLKAKASVRLREAGKLTFQYAFQDNIRKEFNVRRLDRTRIPALNMHLSTHSADISWENVYGRWHSQLGAGASRQVNYNQPGTGVVPIIPNYASFGWGAFAIQKYSSGKWEAEGGLRYDYKILNADGYDAFSQRYGGNRTFHNITYSLGGNYKVSDNWSLTSNIGVAWRAPHVSELYSNGLHHGAGTYDVGDENLQSETGVKWISSVGYQGEKLSVAADFFVQLIQNYIFDAPTGETKTLFSGVYPIFRYQQADAFFRGADLQLTYRFLPNWSYGLQASVVYANELRSEKYFPYIPSERISNEISFELPKLGRWQAVYFSAKHRFVAKQTRFNPEQELVSDTPDAYNLFELGLGGKLPVGKQQIGVHLSAENLFNELYKEYTNRFRYYAHDLGRNIQLRLVYSF